MLRVSKVVPMRCILRPTAMVKASRALSTEAIGLAEQKSSETGPSRHTVIKKKLDPVNVFQAVDIVKKSCWAKFDETIEIAVNLGVDPRKPNQSVKGVARLPHGNGKRVRVCVFATGDNAKLAQDAGAEVVGAEDLVADIQRGIMEFDTVIATPELMSTVGKVGRVIFSHIMLI